MKWALVVALTACSFEHGLAPGPDDGRSLDGKANDAKTVDGKSIDAATGPCNPTACAAAGGTCADSSTCEIDTAGGNVTCPAGMDCLIRCESPSSCDNTVDCGMATSCTIDCTENGSCGGLFVCSHVRCTLYCRGNNTCQDNTIDDSNSACDIECCGNGACLGAFASPTVCSDHGDICP